MNRWIRPAGDWWRGFALAGSVAAAALAAGLSPAVASEPPAPAPPPPISDEEARAIRDEISLLRRRLEELEKRLDQRSPASPAPGAVGLAPSGQPLSPPVPGGAPPPAAPPSKPSVPATAKTLQTRLGNRFQISGYIQTRLTNIANNVGDPLPNSQVEFQITRFRPRLQYLLDENWMAELEVQATTRGSGQFSPRDAFLQYQRDWYQVRLGQAKIPWGYEEYVQGNVDRYELERARFVGRLFPDFRDIGLYARTIPETKTAAWFAAGVYNGNGINRPDNNNAKNVAVTLKVPVDPHNVVGASALAGNFLPDDGSPSFVRQAAGVEHQFNGRRLFTKTEAMIGRDRRADVWGGYAGARYDLGRPGGLFTRYDVYDPNRAVADDMWQRLSLGWYKDLSRSIRLTTEYDFIWDPHVPNNTYGIQVQGVF